MLCQNCKKENATFHFHENINGAVREMHLCPCCAGMEKQELLFFPSSRKQKVEDLFKPGVSVIEKPQKRNAQPSPLPQKRKTVKEMDLSELQQKMQEAVSIEAYEAAAKYRDEINIRKNKAQKGGF